MRDPLEIIYDHSDYDHIITIFLTYIINLPLQFPPGQKETSQTLVEGINFINNPFPIFLS